MLHSDDAAADNGCCTKVGYNLLLGFACIPASPLATYLWAINRYYEFSGIFSVALECNLPIENAFRG